MVEEIREEEEHAKTKQKPRTIYYKKEKEKQNAIFEEEDLVKSEEKPEVRQVQEVVQVEFTERIYPNLAMREQHFKDAPLPRSKKTAPSENKNQDNPLFMKDQADQFFRNKDFYSAINVYTAAYKRNQELIQCIANRSACYLHLYNYKECIDDCNMLADWHSNLKED